jgi:hypothetical protein
MPRLLVSAFFLDMRQTSEVLPSPRLPKFNRPHATENLGSLTGNSLLNYVKNKHLA